MLSAAIASLSRNYDRPHDLSMMWEPSLLKTCYLKPKYIKPCADDAFIFQTVKRFQKVRSLHYSPAAHSISIFF